MEINRTFYSLPLKSTFEKWYSQTPDNFSFTAKIPRSVTHFGRLKKNLEDLEEFFERVEGLKEKFYAPLVQLPPSLKFEKESVESFSKFIRNLYGGKIFIEPRHESWKEVDVMEFGFYPVYAEPGIYWDKEFEMDTAYFRLHGSPKLYYSSYDEDFLKELAKRAVKYDEAVVIFNNTASGAAIENALRLKELIDEAK